MAQFWWPKLAYFIFPFKRCSVISNYYGFKLESKIFLVMDPVDFRKSEDGLRAIIQLELQLDPMKLFRKEKEEQ